MPKSAGRARALPWLVVLVTDAFVVLLSPLYDALSSRAAASGLYIPSLYPSLGGDRWLVASTACSVAVLVILHPAIAAHTARGEGLADRLASAAAPTLAFAPLVGLLAGIAKAAPAAVSLEAVGFRGDLLRSSAIDSMLAGAFWGGVAGATAAATLSAGWLAVQVLGQDGPAQEEPAEAADPDEDLANLARLMGRGLTIALAGLIVAVLLLAVLGRPSIADTAGRGLQDILGAVQWSVPRPADKLASFPAQMVPEDYLPLAVVPAYLLALLVALPIAGLTMGPAVEPIQRLSRAWLAVGAAVVFQAIVAGIALGALALARQPQQIGGSWVRGYATVLNHCLTQLPAAAGYTALVGWIPAVAMAGAAWALDRRTGAVVIPESPERIDDMTRTDIPETWDERAMLATFLDYARATVHAKCEGLSEEDARSAPLATSPLMTISGLVSHLRWVEYSWFQVMLLGEEDKGPWTDEDPDREMRIGAETPLAQLLDEYEAQCAHYRALVATLDLDTLSKRNISTGEPVTLRWILFHLIEETARHNGHIDILREMADGVTGD